MSGKIPFNDLKVVSFSKALMVPYMFSYDD